MYEHVICPVCGDRSRPSGDDRLCHQCFRYMADLASGRESAFDDLLARRVNRDSRLRRQARPLGEADQRAGSDARAARRREQQQREFALADWLGFRNER